jgi:hypothetical protein
MPTVTSLMPVAEKLAYTNHTLWKAQIQVMLHDAQLAGFLDRTLKSPEKMIKIQKGDDVEEVPNPTHEQWKAQEQVLSYLLTSISRDALVSSSCPADRH